MKLEYLKAARIILGWDQQSMADAAGIHVNSYKKVETGQSTIASESGAKVMAALERAGIAIENDGVREIKQPIYKFGGHKAWYHDLQNDILFQLKDKPEDEREILIAYANNSLSGQVTIENWRKMRDAGIKMRQIVQQEDTWLNGPVNEYRSLPSEFFVNYVYIIYGDRVAFCSDEFQEAIVFTDRMMSLVMKKNYEFLWSNLKQPERSDADVRY